MENTATCPACNAESVPIFKCALCGKDFCEKCPGSHAPPSQKTFESKVHFLYKLHTATKWNEDVVRFTEDIITPSCTVCYESECNKALWRLKTKIKNWKAEVRSEEQLRVLDETLPACGAPEQGAKDGKEAEIMKSAQDFLKELVKPKQGGL